MLKDCKNETLWLEERKKYLTASDAGLYCDINPYQDNGPTYLFDLKTGRIPAPDLSGKWAVQRGKMMEKHIRALFMIDNPQFKLSYHQNGLYVCDEIPYLAATLDGLLLDRHTNYIWILEIKTATCQNMDDWRAWKRGEIPQHYIAQGVHQMICVPLAHGVIFYAFVVNAITKEQILVRKEYLREECEDDIAYVKEQAAFMFKCISTGTRPHLKLAI